MNKQQKLILLAAVAGLSAVGLLVLLRRRHRDEDSFDDNGVQGSKEDLHEFADLTASDTIASAAETVIKMNVPQYCVGPIIGKGGENIRKLKKETGARLDFEREIKGEDMKKKDRILEIRGDREKVQNAEIRINQFISEIPKVIEVEILVPQEACGQIIGKRGDTIREINSISGAKVSIDSNQDRSLKGMRRAVLRGTVQQVEYAKGLIEEKIEQSRAFKKLRYATRQGKKRSLSPANRKDIVLSKIPSTGEFFRVFVSAFDIPNHFYIQRVTQESRKLDQLGTEMTSYYGNPELSQDEKPPSRVTPGDVYCAPFEFDDLWYRGSVIEVNEEEKAAVLYYIDYGDTGTVQFDELRRPKPEFLQLEAQAIECFLADIQPKDGKWSDESIDRFEQLSHCAKWSELMARVVRFQEIDGERIPCLELIDTSAETEINIAKTLINEGYAVESSCPTASIEPQLGAIREDVITETPNNNVANMTASIFSSKLTGGERPLANSMEIEEAPSKAENEKKLVGNRNDVNKQHFVPENFTASDALFDKSEAISAGLAETGKSSEIVSFAQPLMSSEANPVFDGHFQSPDDLNHSNRSSVEIASVSSSSTEDTVIHVGGKPRTEARNQDMDEVVKENSQGVEETSHSVEEALSQNSRIQFAMDSLNGILTVLQNRGSEVEDSGVKTEDSPKRVHEDSVDNRVNDSHVEVISHNEVSDANDSGVDLETVSLDPNSKRSVSEEVTRWMERSYEENPPLETIPEGGPLGSSEKAFLHSSMLSGSQLVETETVPSGAPGSPKTFRFQESLELAKENPVMLSDDEDSMTYFSARSEQTIASDNDTLSFKSAPDTPTNNDEFQFPTKDDSILDYDIITTPIGSDDERLLPDFNRTPATTKLSPRTTDHMGEKAISSASNQTPKYQIKFIDESGKQDPKVLSASMENVSSTERAMLNPKLSASTPQFGELQASQTRFGGSDSFFGKETSI